MITSQKVFNDFVKENGRFPTREEFMALGYCSKTYYNCRNNYKPAEA